MRKFIALAAATAATLFPVAVFAAEGRQQFVHDGSTYVFTRTAANGGREVIEGRRYPSGQPFRLIVRGDRVSGTAGGVPVAFRLAAAEGAAGGAPVIAR